MIMKTLSTFCLLSLVNLFAYSQIPYQIRVDSITDTRYNVTTQTWDFYQSEYYSYHWNGSMTKRLRYAIQQNKLVAERSYYTYNHGRLTEQKLWMAEDYHTDSTMLYNGRKVYTYDANDSLISLKHFVINNNQNEYLNWEVVNTYRQDGKLSSRSTIEWNVAYQRLDTVLRESYTYQNGLKVALHYTAFDIGSESWMTGDKILYQYNPDGELIQEDYHYWDPYSQSYYLSITTIHLYNSSQLRIQSTSYGADSSLAFKYDYDYDIQGNPKRIKFTVSYDGSIWQSYGTSDFTYDSNFLKDEVAKDPVNALGYFYYLPQSSIHAPLEIKHVLANANDTLRRQIHYSAFPLAINNTELTEVNSYPNPVTDYLYFENPDINQKITVQIFDISGRRILSEELNTSDCIAVHKLKPGVYILNIKSNDSVYSKKIVKK